MAELPKEQLDALLALTNVEADYFRLLIVNCEDWAKKGKATLSTVHFFNYESDAYRSSTHVGHR